MRNSHVPMRSIERPARAITPLVPGWVRYPVDGVQS